jgi:hypothetical protein
MREITGEWAFKKFGNFGGNGHEKGIVTVTSKSVYMTIQEMR